MLSFMPRSTEWPAHLFPKAGAALEGFERERAFLTLSQEVLEGSTSHDLPVGRS
jgi:hypothetical protein